MGGGQYQLLELLRGIVAGNRFEPLALIDTANQELASSLRGFGVKVFELGASMPRHTPRRQRSLTAIVRTLPSRIRPFLSYLRRLDEVIRATDPEIVYANTFLMALAAAFLKRRHHFRLVHAVMSSLAYANHGRLDGYVIRRCDGVLFNSEFTRQSFQNLLAGNPTPDAINYSLVPDPRSGLATADKIDELRSQLRGAREFAIGFVGRIVPRKRVEDFVHLAELLNANSPRVRCVILGDGDHADPYFQDIARRATALGANAFQMLGHRSGIMDWIAALDVLVLPTDGESFGRVVVEAGYVGTPVVATRPGGPEEIVSTLEGSVTVPLGDIAAMAGAVEKILGGSRPSDPHNVILSDDFLTRFGEHALISLESDFYDRVLSTAPRT